MEGRPFNSLQEAQETLDRVVNKLNNTPHDDFYGLSPAQIHPLLGILSGKKAPPL